MEFSGNVILEAGEGGGVASAYRCQPVSIVAVRRPATLDPGAALAGSTLNDHLTGSSRWAEPIPASVASSARTRNTRNPKSDIRNPFSQSAPMLTFFLPPSSLSIRWLIWPRENSAATRVAFLMALALERPREARHTPLPP